MRTGHVGLARTARKELARSRCPITAALIGHRRRDRFLRALLFVEHHNVVNVLAFGILAAPRGRPGLSVCGHFRRNRHHYLPIFLLHSTTSKFVVPGDASAACQHWLDQTESTAQILGATPVPSVWLSRVDSGSFAILYHFRAIPSDGLETNAGSP